MIYVISVLQEFCKISLEFIKKGANIKVYQSAARKSFTEVCLFEYMINENSWNTWKLYKKSRVCVLSQLCPWNMSETSRLRIRDKWNKLADEESEGNFWEVNWK